MTVNSQGQGLGFTNCLKTCMVWGAHSVPSSGQNYFEAWDRYAASLSPSSACTAPWARTCLPPEVCSKLLGSSLLSAWFSWEARWPRQCKVLYFCPGEVILLRVTLIKKAAIVTQTPLMEVGRLPKGGLADACLELQGCLIWICAGFSPQLSWLKPLSCHTKPLSLQALLCLLQQWDCGQGLVVCSHFSSFGNETCKEIPALPCEKRTCGTHKKGAALSGGRIDSGGIPNLAAQWSHALGHHFPFHYRDSFYFSLHCTFGTYVWNHCRLLCAFRPSLK